jgi:translation initiation factor IF-3
LRVNQQIRAREVRLVDDEGRQLGVMPARDALRLAVERGLDLVEVAPNAAPVVCRIMDYGRFKYEQEKRDREARKKQHVTMVKELVMKANIADHDLQILGHRGERFLQEGHKLKVTMRFKGREIVHADLGRQVLQRLRTQLAPLSNVESEPRLEGRTLVMMVAPRPEVLQAARRGAADAGPDREPPGPEAAQN